MTTSFTMPQMIKVTEALAPATDAGGRSGAWVSLKSSPKLYVYFYVAQEAANTIALTFQQATSIAGAGAKVLTGTMRIWANEAFATTDTLTEQTAALTFTTSAATTHKLVVFEIIPEANMDVSNGFDCIQVITGASSASNLTSALYYGGLLSYQQASPPSAMLD